jgi:hypothetical protein
MYQPLSPIYLCYSAGAAARFNISFMIKKKVSKQALLQQPVSVLNESL